MEDDTGTISPTLFDGPSGTDQVSICNVNREILFRAHESLLRDLMTHNELVFTKEASVDVGEHLGKGGFCTVSKVTNGCAFKKWIETPKLHVIAEEMYVFTRLDHVHVIPCLGMNFHPTCIGTYFPIVQGLSLHSWIIQCNDKLKITKKRKESVTEEIAEKCSLIRRQSTCAIAYLHRQGVIHYDVSLGNILIHMKNKTVMAVLIDLQCSATGMSFGKWRHRQYTLSPPEAFEVEQRPIDLKRAEAYVYGIVMLCLSHLTCRPTYAHHLNRPDSGIFTLVELWGERRIKPIIKNISKANGIDKTRSSQFAAKLNRAIEIHQQGRSIFSTTLANQTLAELKETAVRLSRFDARERLLVSDLHDPDNCMSCKLMEQRDRRQHKRR